MSEEQKNDVETPQPKAAARRHLIRNPWVRIPLKTLMWLVVAVLMIPVLLYIPPVQTLVKNVACRYIASSTGMKVGIDRFRLRFPVKVELDGVYVLDTSADTMVRASRLVADVRLMPLFSLDVKINRLLLESGYYRMVSPDSSMVLALDARRLEVDDRSSFDIASSDISLNRADVYGGSLSLYMDVWRQKPTPTDTASTPFLIKANDLRLHDFSFAMSMLPTIDTLTLRAADVTLAKGVVDLRSGNIRARSMRVARGAFSYIAPTPEYVAAHPVPVDSTSASQPMRIAADSVSLDSFSVLYAIKGARPLPGFDPSYISLSDVGIGMRNFFNEASTVKLPVTRLAAKERSGLVVTSARGNVDIDSTGIALDNLHVNTPYSSLTATAGIPFALMEMKPEAPLAASISGSLGIPDIEAFMPDVKPMTSSLPRRDPIALALEAGGTLSRASIRRLEAAMSGAFSLQASGFADNALDFNRMKGEVVFDARLDNPSIMSALLGKAGFKVPVFSLKGTAAVASRAFDADLRLLTPKGDVAATGYVSLSSEGYSADIDVRRFNVAQIMPSLGIGVIDGSLRADGAGFDPTRPGAETQIEARIRSIEYNRRHIDGIDADISLRDGSFDISASTHNRYASIDIDGSGTLAPDYYTFDIRTMVRELNLYELGMSKTQNAGCFDIFLKGSAAPQRWLYDADLRIDSIQWTSGNSFYRAAAPITFSLDAREQSVEAFVTANRARLDLSAGTGLRSIVGLMPLVADSLSAQIARRDLNVEALQQALPPFSLDLAASGRGILGQFLHASGMNVDSIHASFSNDSLLRGSALAMRLNTGSMMLDTLSLALQERGRLIDYKAHLGNRKGNLPELAGVDINGYFGSNRLLASVTQRNAAGQTGYRLGVTAALLDSAVNLHFTPLKAIIAYKQWNINLDNHVQYDFNGHIDANLEARSNESSIGLKTSVSQLGYDQLHLALQNIHIEDFLNLSVFAPPLTATVNSDLTIGYTATGFQGGGRLTLSDFTYDRVRVGDIGLDLTAGLENSGETSARVAMDVDGKPAALFSTLLVPDSVSRKLTPKEFDLNLTHFPLSIANPFLGRDVASLSGGISGALDLSGSFTEPVLNGSLVCDSVGVLIPMAGTRLRFDHEPLTVTNNVLAFNNYDIWAVNSNPITINGSVDASSLSDVKFDLAMAGQNVQLVGTRRNARSQIRGNLFMNLDASARGPMKHFTVNANASVLPATDVTYVVDMMASQLDVTDAGGVVKFVNFADTTSVVKGDSVPQTMAMRVIASLGITAGAQVTVNLGEGTDKVQLRPSGTLSYFQNFMGDMRLNGQLNLGEGFARYTIPVMGQKTFDFLPESYVAWSGNVMNPTLSIHATDHVKATVVEGGNSRLVNFLLQLNVTNSLAAPKVGFDLQTEDDMTIQNQLSSMTPDQRSQLAINMLVTGQYKVGGTHTDTNMTNQLYGMLTSQLNQWAAKAFKGVDLSFGIDQYDRTVEGRSSTAMSYSYQMSKSLFNNRFRINVGGNYTTDASADENLAENLISDISFEYMLRQTANMTMYARLVRHTGFESILEGEITETGVGFVMKRRLSSLRGLFRFGRRRKAAAPDSVRNTAAAIKPDSIEAKPDSTNNVSL